MTAASSMNGRSELATAIYVFAIPSITLADVGGGR